MTWFHGSEHQLAVLRTGSSITENRAIARAFSHRPKAVSVEEDGRVRHTGTAPGYLYEVTETLTDDDIAPHPHPVNDARWEWLTRRPVRLRLLERTEVRPDDVLTADELARPRQRVADSGQSGSALL